MSSLYWNIGLYKKISKDEAECNECKSKIKTKDFNTTGLKTHTKQHPEYLAKYEQLKQQKNEAAGTSMDKFVKINGSG
jgi:hypothetical protein